MDLEDFHAGLLIGEGDLDLTIQPVFFFNKCKMG